METKTKIIIVIVAIALGFGAGYFAKPSSVRTITVEKIIKEQSKAEVQTRIIYKEKTVKPDGTVTEIEKTDNSNSSTDITKINNEKSTSQTIKNDIGLNISALAIANSSNITGTREYGIHISKRVISNITVGAFADTEKKIGVSIGINF
jgi:hypothetical protein